MYKPKLSKTKSRDRWGDWSDWVWSEEQQRYYKWRQSSEGAYDYEWAPQSGSSAAAAAAAAAATADPVDVRTPRGGELEDITEGVQKLSTLDGSEYPESGQTEDVASYGSSPNQYAYQSGPASSRLPKSNKGSSSKKGKSKAYDDEDDEENVENPSAYQPRETRDAYRRHAASTQGPQSYETPSYQSTTQAHSAYNQTYSYGQQPYTTSGSDVPSTYPSSTRYPTSTAETEPSVTAGSGMPSDTEQYASDPYGSGYSHYTGQNSRVHFVPQPTAIASDDEEDPNESEAFQQALEESRLYQQHHSHGPGESSAAAAPAPTYARQPYDPELEQRQTTPTPMGHMPDIRGTGGEAESLDPRYRVEPSNSFQPGEVFKVLWSEPSGTNVGGTPTISDRKEIRNQYGLSFYVGFRRFIVIANDEGHCTCVPILTYGGKGCKKKGVKPQKHGIIHEKGHKARQLLDEPKLGFSPVRMMIEAEGEKLAKESRANYSKLVTIEHNVKVFFIGHIVPEDWEMVRDAVNRCWEDKIHHKRKAHGRYAKG